MHHRILVPLLAALSLLVAASASANSPHRYNPKHGAKCHKGYRRVTHHGHVYCVKSHKRRGAAKTAQKVKLHAHLDPTYTRNPLDPFEVTYAYSASATQEPVAHSASISTEEPASLPSGVLALYSDGKLECAVNVGGSETGSECPVQYQALGEHRVTTIYSSGEESATETEVESILPLATATTLTVHYQQLQAAEEVTGTGWWWIGNLVVQPSAEPPGVATSMACPDEPPEAYGRITDSNCYIISAGESHVYGWFNCDEERAALVRITEAAPTSIDPTIPWPSGEAIEAGELHLRAVSSAVGYQPSEATTPVQFRPLKATTC